MGATANTPSKAVTKPVTAASRTSSRVAGGSDRGEARRQVRLPRRADVRTVPRCPVRRSVARCYSMARRAARLVRRASPRGGGFRGLARRTRVAGAPPPRPPPAGERIPRVATSPARPRSLEGRWAMGQHGSSRRSRPRSASAMRACPSQSRALVASFEHEQGRHAQEGAGEARALPLRRQRATPSPLADASSRGRRGDRRRHEPPRPPPSRRCCPLGQSGASSASGTAARRFSRIPVASGKVFLGHVGDSGRARSAH